MVEVILIVLCVSSILINIYVYASITNDFAKFACRIKGYDDRFELIDKAITRILTEEYNDRSE